MARDDERNWREVLRNARTDPIGQALEGLCGVEMARIKDLLLDAPAGDVQELQGEGRAIRTTYFAGGAGITAALAERTHAPFFFTIVLR